MSHVLAAYFAAWLIILFYAAYLEMKVARAKRELARLNQVAKGEMV